MIQQLDDLGKFLFVKKEVELKQVFVRRDDGGGKRRFNCKSAL